jgi:hypothetical protein
MIVYMSAITNFSNHLIVGTIMTNGGGPGHHTKGKKKPATAKSGKTTVGKNLVSSKLRAAAKQAVTTKSGG